MANTNPAPQPSRNPWAAKAKAEFDAAIAAERAQREGTVMEPPKQEQVAQPVETPPKTSVAPQPVPVVGATIGEIDLSGLELPSVDAGASDPVSEKLAAVEAENKKIMEELAAERKERERQRTEEELRQRDAKFERLLALEDIEDDVIDRSTLSNVLRSTVSELEQRRIEAEQALAARMAATAKETREVQEKTRTEEAEKLRAKTNARIFDKHPDFDQITKTPAYSQLLLTQYPNSNLTWHEVLAEQYQKGNADFIIGVLDRVKASRPSLENVASVAPVMAATAPTGDSKDNSSEVLSEQEQADLRYKLQRGEISREEFTAKLDASRKALKAQTS